MRRLDKQQFEKTRIILETERPVKARNIDFTNPYFTQPKDAPREMVNDLYERLKGSSIRHIYVHVPFCATRCRYCHYPTVTNVHSEDNQTLFVQQVEQEIAHYLELGLDFSRVLTVHVGGGTPNCLNDQNLERLVTRLQSAYRPAEELAVELYPSPFDLTESKLKRIQAAGVNRLSLGVQTFNYQVNELNHRINQEQESLFRLIKLAQAHCNNVSIDLLYGQKGQDIRVLEDDCRIARELNVNSVYLYQTRELIHMKALDLQLALNHFLWFFSANGYEIVSFDQVIRKRNTDGFCAHRSGRSLSENLLGIGPGAVSEIDTYIFRNVDPGTYASQGHGLDPSSIITRSSRTLRSEYVNRALRHYNYPGINGTWTSKYQERFGSSMLEDFNGELAFLQELGLISYDAEKLEVTELGMHFTQHINYYLLGHYK
jgi:coproporphyrinogen III oxidase-like Fe-S oxidoreductase